MDNGIALYFPAPRSLTGQEVLELQGHGGPGVVWRVLSRCFDLGARAAEPGEFALRAYLNGKMDLAQADAVADIVNAESAAGGAGGGEVFDGCFFARDSVGFRFAGGGARGSGGGDGFCGRGVGRKQLCGGRR